jgi:hypothetical protein
VKITARSSLETVAFAVGDALRRAGIRAVLTGGSCACVHTNGEYQSFDIDFVLQSSPSQASLDAVMDSLGYDRDGARYLHSRSSYFIEFPRGPLAVGAEHGLRPVVLRLGDARIEALSPTDSCRDRLAAFYHWNDRPSLVAAIAIAQCRKVNMAVIERWSRSEDALERFQEFKRKLARPPAAPRTPRRRKPSTRH